MPDIKELNDLELTKVSGGSGASQKYPFGSIFHYPDTNGKISLYFVVIEYLAVSKLYTCEYYTVDNELYTASKGSVPTYYSESELNVMESVSSVPYWQG